MNFYWAAVDGKLAIDHNGHTATLTRLGDKQWRAHVVLRKQRGVGPLKKIAERSNGFNTRRQAATWAAAEIGLRVSVDLMTFASLMLDEWRA